jgi:hypothetical protein
MLRWQRRMIKLNIVLQQRAAGRWIALILPLIVGLGLQPFFFSATASAEDFDQSAPQFQNQNGRPEYALSWESAQPDGFKWTEFTLQTLATATHSLENGARDVQSFCPNYANLTSARKLNFWGVLVSAIVRYETGFNPLARYRETTMGIDPITHQRVYSEGLMQLSYQDVTGHTFCNQFDWQTDARLSPTDPRKSILDPYKNLRCGIQILDWQVARHGAISFQGGQYWAVLRAGSRKAAQIRALTNQIPFCQR